ncbi:MAG: agmatine deiminase family protein [Deltaproteobacteria bacterium]|nr:agmatine deiminase family protein [Deltaproteobacteria bacterium]
MSPKKNAFSMPAEWEPHRATWICWPHQESDWLEKFPAIRWVYAEIVRVLSKSEQVCIICHDASIRELAASTLSLCGIREETCRFYIQANDRSWLRDSGPTAVRTADGNLAWIKWTFNAWAKYENFEFDRNVPQTFAAQTGIPLVNAVRSDNSKPFVLEGGAIECDGRGTLMVTEECLLSQVQERNPGLTRSQYEQHFKQYLGTEKTIWLGRGCEGDDTHGHIDDIARFTAPGKVLLAFEDDPSDPFHEASQDNLHRLSTAKDARGRSLEVAKLPMPGAIYYDGYRLPASYANFYISNQAVLVPTFNDPRDYQAITQIKKAFPGRQVVGINSTDLILGMGTLHCLTQQEPQSFD